MNVFSRWHYLLLILSFFFNLSGSDTISLLNKKAISLSNWEVFLSQNKNALPGKQADIILKNTLVAADSLEKFSGVCWFRKTFATDSSFKNTPSSLSLNINGAAEIYHNRKLVLKIGSVGFSEDSETRLYIENKVVTLYFEPRINHELLIRYSNHKIHQDYYENGSGAIGFTATIHSANNFYEEYFSTLTVSLGLGLVLFSFFSSLCLLHFLIFLFNRSEVSNLYYSLFCFSLATLMLALFEKYFFSSEAAYRCINIVTVVSPAIIFIIIAYMFRSFFLMKFPRWYLVFPTTGVLFLFMVLLKTGFAPLLLFLLIIIASVETLRILFIAFRQRKPGVKIIGAGAVFFLLLIVAFLGLIVYSAYIGENMHIQSTTVLVFIIFSIISIPVSITVFLAYRISITNRSLAQKLIEVEKLSSQTIEQEKEKQFILENQKATLELQVNERTIEITVQKKIIEEKNKDIIDSITYAKRIQSAMLPDENSFSSVFKRAFVLYEPRDIVSGDFYYAANTAEGKLIIAADCTGHGVPGALMSMVGSNIINKLVHENKLSDPKHILENLHKELRHALKQDVEGSVNRDGMDVCAVLITEKETKFAGANRPLIYFTNDNVMHELKATKTPVGGSHIETVCLNQHSLALENIKEIFLFSDGFADQFGGPEGKKLMVSRFKTWLQEVITLQPQSQKEILYRKYADWKQQAEQVDDVMVIGIVTGN